MKHLAMLLVVFMSLGMFVACAPNNKGAQSDKGGTQTDDKGTQTDEKDTQTEDNVTESESKEPVDAVYDVGDITVAVPEGWKTFNNTDIHADDPNTISKRSVNICKGGVIETDIFTKPYIKIDYYGSDIYMMAPDKSFYENVVDVAPVELGARVWSGFSCESLGYPIIILTAENGDDQFQLNIFRGQGEDTISLEDEDVKRIIESITVKPVSDTSASEEGSAE